MPGANKGAARLLDQLGVKRHHALRMGLEEFKQRRHADRAHLDRLGDAFDELPPATFTSACIWVSRPSVRVRVCRAPVTGPRP